MAFGSARGAPTGSRPTGFTSLPPEHTGPSLPLPSLGQLLACLQAEDSQKGHSPATGNRAVGGAGGRKPSPRCSPARGARLLQRR